MSEACQAELLTDSARHESERRGVHPKGTTHCIVQARIGAIFLFKSSGRSSSMPTAASQEDVVVAPVMLANPKCRYLSR